MIFKELTKKHFNEKNVDRILFTSEYLIDTFYDIVVTVKNTHDLNDILKTSFNCSFLFIDIMTLHIEVIKEIFLVISKQTFSKVFLVYSSPMKAIALRDKCSNLHCYGSNSFGVTRQTTLVINRLSEDIYRLINKTINDEMTIYVPFPSYHPYDKEFITSNLLSNLRISESSISIMYFNSTNPYDIFYKLIEDHQEDKDYLFCCDKLILSSVMCFITRLECEYYIISTDEVDSSFKNCVKFYEISDLV